MNFVFFVLLAISLVAALNLVMYIYIRYLKRKRDCLVVDNTTNISISRSEIKDYMKIINEEHSINCRLNTGLNFLEVLEDGFNNYLEYTNN